MNRIKKAADEPKGETSRFVASLVHGMINQHEKEVLKIYEVELLPLSHASTLLPGHSS
jgi:hypothetical protein